MPAASPRLVGLLHFALLAAVLLRLLTLPVLSLLDPTEARYGVIAAHMLASGDWITPQIWTGGGFEPYLGKPPMQFWLMAAAVAAFGKNEWAARLPSCLAGAIILWTTVRYARLRFGTTSARLSGLILLTGGLFFVLSGSVNLDLTVAACAHVAVIAFCRVGDGPTPHRRAWGHVFFISLALGFLTKGPVVIAYAGLAGIMHLLVFRNWRIVTGLPWLGGVPLFLLITVPWFWIAQRHNPDFLRYFFVNENLGRFTSHDYGDRYGEGRTHAFGAVWVFFVACSLPWSAAPLVALNKRTFRQRAFAARRSESSFLLLWACSPALLFTFSPQFTVGYLAPGLGAMAIFVARTLEASAATPLFAPRFAHNLTRVVLGLAAATAVCGIWLNVVPARCLLALTGVVLLWFVLAPHRRGEADLERSVAAAALATATAYAVILVAAAPYVNGRNSIAPILASYFEERAPGPQSLALASWPPDSARFYWSAWASDAVGWSRIAADDLAASPVRDVLVKRPDLDAVMQAAGPHFVTTKQIGAWTWLTRK